MRRPRYISRASNGGRKVYALKRSGQPVAKGRKLTRAERAHENRARLIHAAKEVVGRHGYAEASVARIVERAGLAQGTFYLYFESRQDLFDQLLPEIGGEALSYIRDAVTDTRDFMVMEEQAMRGFFEYAVQNPDYFRIFSEAEIAAPAAYLKYTRKRTGSFLDVVTAAWKRGEIKGYTKQELGVLTQLMLAARAYLFQEYAKTASGTKTPSKWVVEAYMKFLAHGLGGGAATAKETKGATPKRPTKTPGPRRTETTSRAKQTTVRR
jgi:AcrR family transcriptional regulator